MGEQSLISSEGQRASLIKPVVPAGIRTSGLPFVATDIDAGSLASAAENVARNEVADRIRLLHVLPTQPAAGAAPPAARSAPQADVTATPANDTVSSERLDRVGATAAVSADGMDGKAAALAPPAPEAAALAPPAPEAAGRAITAVHTDSLLCAAVLEAERLSARLTAEGVHAAGAAQAATPASGAARSAAAAGVGVLEADSTRGDSSGSSADASVAHAMPAVAFTVCNPPFFGSWEEACASMEGHEGSACAGSPNEMATPGGEVAFVGRMVTESASALRRRVLWFSSMLGKAASVDAVVARLRGAGVPTVRTRELVQGRTRRWAVAWSFFPPHAFLGEHWRISCPWRLDAP